MQFPFAYTVRTYRRSKHIRVIVRNDGTVLVTKPPFVRKAIAEHFLASKKEWVLKEIERAHNGVFFDASSHTREHYEAHKEDALRYLNARVVFWNRFYSFPYTNIRVRRMTSRWGSCSHDGRLTFNYKLAFLPAHIVDYVVVHELCHLKEFNHSKQFWSLVLMTQPHYKKIKKELLKIK